ncbi:uncharacterized protein LOC116262150 isoform X2 [Nymphaea colorata]|uniref:uncharacterized protein LOC116262150 isoform X2 n=1 Tax=Nymphaea colorata TaxID=210225 RepID=UPI00129D7C83|nr:uncharacterized protein LOC116262150 isoform X2 [Nymphaea colorata]
MFRNPLTGEEGRLRFPEQGELSSHNMTDDLLKDVLGVKTFKKSQFVMRTLLIFAFVFGAYICFVCLKQISPHADPSYNLATVQVFRRHHCNASGFDPKERAYLHYPKPKNFSRGECLCNPVRFFAILSMQRSGSGWFETLLNSHLNISSNGEIFSSFPRRSNVSSVFMTLDQVYNLDWYSSAAKNSCSAAVGLKWMLNQGLMKYHEEIVSYFNRRQVSVIFLFRKNLLHRMVSVLANTYDQSAKQINGTHRSHVHSQIEADLLSKYKPSINSTLLLTHLQQTEETAAEALKYFKSTRHIILYYEDIVSNQTRLIDVQEFLGVPVMNLTSRQVKIHTRPLSHQVENWSDVYNTLKGTRYQDFLEQ